MILLINGLNRLPGWANLGRPSSWYYVSRYWRLSGERNVQSWPGATIAAGHVGEVGND